MLLLIRITIHIPVEVKQNLITFKKNKKKYKKVYIRSTIRIFTDYKRKTGISPLLANKDRWMDRQIRKTIMDYGQTKYSQVLPGTTQYLLLRIPQTYDQGTIPFSYFCIYMNKLISRLIVYGTGCQLGGVMGIFLQSRYLGLVIHLFISKNAGNEQQAINSVRNFRLTVLRHCELYVHCIESRNKDIA